MSRLFSNSLLILGIIEDIDLSKIKKSIYRRRISETNFLYNSIKEKGLLQPIIVRPINDYFEIIAGNRRYDACKKLGWKKIICHIVEADDKEAFEIGLVENIQRKNLDPIEEAEVFKIYVENYGWGGISDLAQRIGKSVAYIDKRLKLVELSEDIVSSVRMHDMSPSTAEELIVLDSKEKQSTLARMIVENKLSSRMVRSMVRDIRKENHNDDTYCLLSQTATLEEIDRETRKVFDKSITILKMASQKLALLVPEMQKNWIVSEILMQQKFALDTQVNILIKLKKKL